MLQVVKASPAREDYRFTLAQALTAQGDYSHATAFLGPLVNSGRTQEIKEAARRLLGNISTEKNSTRTATSDGSRQPAASPADAPSAQPTAPRRESAQSGVFVPVLRPLLAGETRVLGTFASVECIQGAIVMQVDTPDGAIRIAAARFEEVEFLTYRPDMPGSVACGPQRPAYRVLATFRTSQEPIAAAKTPNRAVAIELLPDGYTPR